MCSVPHKAVLANNKIAEELHRLKNSDRNA